MMPQILKGIKIFDFGWAMMGGQATKLLADFGAEVVKLESMTHVDFMRTNGFLRSCTSRNDPNDKPYSSWLNTSKYGLAMNTKHPKAKEVIAEYYKWADVVFENFSPGKIDKQGFGYEFAKTVNPDIIFCHASIYGQTGPLSRQAGTDGMGSSVGCHRGLTGWPDRTPVPNSPMVLGDMLTPLVIASGILAALDYRRRTGKGQEIDFAMLDVIAMKSSPLVLDYAANGHVTARDGNHVPYASPHAAFPCKGDDRWCAIAVYKDEEWPLLCRAMGDPEWSRKEEYRTFEGRKADQDFIEQKIGEWTAEWDPQELMKYLQERGVPAGAVQTLAELIDVDPLLKERRYFVPLDHPVQGVIPHPRAPYILSKTPSDERIMTAGPWLGEHTFETATRFAGLSDERFVELDKEGLFV